MDLKKMYPNGAMIAIQIILLIFLIIPGIIFGIYRYAVTK